MCSVKNEEGNLSLFSKANQINSYLIIQCFAGIVYMEIIVLNLSSKSVWDFEKYAYKRPLLESRKANAF